MSAKHPYYTEIYQRSFDAIVKNGWLSEILLALITDPLEAEDLAERIERIEKGEQLWVLPAAKGQRRYIAPTSVEDFRQLNIEAKTSWRVTMAQWVMHFEDARPAMKSLTRYDQRLGVWCACQVAREALRFVHDRELRPLRAIETTEEWVRGKATVAQVRKATDAAYDAAADADAADADDAAYAASSSAYAASSAYADAAYDAAAYAASDAAYAAVYSAYAAAYSAELMRLREVVANACMTFPI